MDALGIQAHLLAEDFDRRRYRRSLNEVADRGLQIVIIELGTTRTWDPGRPTGLCATP